MEKNAINMLRTIKHTTQAMQIIYVYLMQCLFDALQESKDVKTIMDNDEIDHFGGCHCGSIKFKVTAPVSPIIVHCK